MTDNKKTDKIHPRSIGLDYLRGFLMILVVIHHSILAYVSSGTGVLINDANNFSGFGWIALYNDNFFMYLFFLISGLFSLSTMKKKGVKLYLNERFIRLMFPFAVGTLFINPLAHYLSYSLYIKQSTSFLDYLEFFLATFGKISADHLWFLWVLFVFSIFLGVIYLFFKNKFSRFASILQPFKMNIYNFIIIMIILGSLSLIPVAHIGNGGFIKLIQPFQMQLSRILIYFLYFIAGVLLGEMDLKQTFLYKEAFQKKWWVFLSISIISTVILRNLLNSLYSGVADNMILQIALFFLKLLPVLISLFASMGLLGLFIGYVKKSNKLLDLIAKEAIGIYVIHYTVVSVYQYIFTGVDISGLIKGILVIFLSLVTSFFCVYLLNKVPYVNVVFGAKNHCKNGLFLMIITSIMLIVLMIP